MRMSQRSILAGKNQAIIIKAGFSVVVKGQDAEMVTAETKGRGVSQWIDAANQKLDGRGRRLANGCSLMYA